MRRKQYIYWSIIIKAVDPMYSRKILPTHQDVYSLVCRIQINGLKVNSYATVELWLSIQAHTMKEPKNYIHIFSRINVKTSCVWFFIQRLTIMTKVFHCVLTIHPRKCWHTFCSVCFQINTQSPHLMIYILCTWYSISD